MSNFKKYTLQPGDNLWDLAKKNNTTVDEIMSYNLNITDPNMIYAGQAINMPYSNASSSGSTTTTPTTTPAQQYEYTPFEYDAFQYDDFEESEETKLAKDNKTNAENALANYGDFAYSRKDYLDDIVDKALNREKFSYDLNGDALYQQYKDKYIKQGKLAMGDAIGQASAMTGGYGNSYAQSVGQQQYQAQLDNLNDIVPELYQMALDKYNMEGQDLYNQYGMLSDDRNMEYGMWGDKRDALVADRGYYASEYDNAFNRDWGMYSDNRGFAYDQYSSDRDLAHSEHTTSEGYKYQTIRDAIADEQWQKDFEEAQRQHNEDLAFRRQQYANSLTTEDEDEDEDEDEGVVVEPEYDYDYVLKQVKDDVKSGASISSISNYLRTAWKAGYITDAQYEKLKATYVPRSGSLGTNTVSAGHYTY